MPSFAGMARKAAELPVPGKRKRGRRTKRWMNSVKKDLELRGLKEEDVKHQNECTPGQPCESKWQQKKL